MPFVFLNRNGQYLRVLESITHTGYHVVLSALKRLLGMEK